MTKKDSELEETINVLLRLKNIANDELNGTTKITTKMGNYNVVSKHGVSFIQRSNLKQELKALLKKSHTAAKSLISTLIMMASNDDAHYSDPKLVGKVLAVLDKIINSNTLKKNNLRVDFAKESKMSQEIIENASNLVANLQEGAIKAQYGMELCGKETLMYNRDLQFYGQADQRRASRKAFQESLCAKEKKMTTEYQTRYCHVSKRIEELRNEINESQ